MIVLALLVARNRQQERGVDVSLTHQHLLGGPRLYAANFEVSDIYAANLDYEAAVDSPYSRASRGITGGHPHVQVPRRRHVEVSQQRFKATSDEPVSSARQTTCRETARHASDSCEIDEEQVQEQRS
jgi:hypothetical protein